MKTLIEIIIDCVSSLEMSVFLVVVGFCFLLLLSGFFDREGGTYRWLCCCVVC